MTPDREIAARYLAIQGIGAEATALAMTFFKNRDSLSVSLKGAQDWLTKADGAVEALIRQRIADAFPEDRVLGGWVTDFFTDDGVRTGNPILASAPGIAAVVSAATELSLMP